MKKKIFLSLVIANIFWHCGHWIPADGYLVFSIPLGAALLFSLVAEIGEHE